MKAPRMILRTVDAYASLDKRRGDSLSCQSWRQLPSCVGSCAADAHEVFQRARRNTGDADEHQTVERAAETLVDVEAGKAAVQFEVVRSEEHTSELQSLMRSSYAVFWLKKKKKLV